MKIVFVNRFFHPDISATSQLLSDLAFSLAGRFEVVVVTSRQRYEDPRARFAASERIGGVTVHRVWTTHFGRAALPGRVLDYLTFYVSAAARLAVIARRNDVVVALTDPPLIAVPASIVAWLRGARLVNWLQDVFPETAEALDLRALQGLLAAPLKWLRDRSLAGASVNVVLGDAMAATIAGRGVPAGRVRIVHNWAPGTRIKPLAREENPLRREWGLEERFVVGYSGNMGRAHDLGILLEAADRLRARTDIAFLFIGAGNQRGALEESAGMRMLENVTFRPYQPREALPRSLTVPDCHVVSLKPSLEGLVFPSKLYGALASGRPVLFIGAPNGEISRLIQTDRFGLCVAPSDAEALANAIELLCDHPAETLRMGDAGRRLFERRFDGAKALAEWSALLDEVPGPESRLHTDRN